MEHTNHLKQEIFNKVVLRDDVYPTQNNKGEYRPVKETFTPQIYFDDSNTVGAYLLDKSNQVKCFCIDIDVNKEPFELSGNNVDKFKGILQQQAVQIKEVLNGYGFECYLEDSGNKGYHVWAFLESPQLAKNVRYALAEYEKQFTLVSDDLHWEIFPKQDELKNDGYGNLIKLPLQIHKKSGRHSHFVDDTFQEYIPEKLETYKQNFPSPPVPEKAIEDKTAGNSDGKLKPTNDDNMQSNCGALNDIIDKAINEGNLTHEERIRISNLYLPFEKGKEKIHSLFRHLKDYDKTTTNKHLDSLNGAPSLCSSICGLRECENVLKTNYKSPIGFAYQKDDGGIFIKDGKYFVRGNQKKPDRFLTEWVIIDSAILANENDGSAILKCTIKSTRGDYYDRQLPFDSFSSKNKLLKGLGHFDLTYHGNDQDIQNLARYIARQVKSRKQGINYIGVYKGIFVANGINISKDMISVTPDIEIISNESDDSIPNCVEIKNVSNTGVYRDFLESLYATLPNINTPETIYPYISWAFSLPLKEAIQKEYGAFPILHGYGEQGDGKTATGEIITKMYGFLRGKPYESRMTPFAMLKHMQSTNTIPFFLDEFRGNDMDGTKAQTIYDKVRGIYRGTTESRGRADQTVVNYHLRAPVIISGEYKFTDQALLERILISHFDNSIKQKSGGSFVDNFKEFSKLDLSLFPAQYIHWALNQDVVELMSDSEEKLQSLFPQLHLSERIKFNWTVLIGGMLLFERFAQHWDIDIPIIPYKKIIEGQLHELGLSKTGEAKRHVDSLIEHMAILVENDYAIENTDWNKNGGEVQLVLKSMLAKLTRYKEMHKQDFFIMDEHSFRNQIKQSKYFVGLERRRFSGSQKRCVVLDYQKMIDQDLEVEGFCLWLGNSDNPFDQSETVETLPRH